MNKQLNAIDLFCGAGGLSKGFMDVGFNILVGVDGEAGLFGDNISVRCTY